MANELCNLDDRRELEHLRSLREKGIDGSRMLRDAEEFDPESGRLRVGNVRLDKFDVAPEAKDLMQDLIEEGHYFVEQRRGTLNFEKTGELAKQLKPKVRLRPGQTLNAEELESLANAVGGLSVRATEAARIAEENPTPENTLKAAAARLEANVALASLSGAKTEAARSLSIQRKLFEGLASRDMRLMRQALKSSEGRYTEKEIAALLAKIDPNDVHAQYRFLNSLWRPKAGDYLMAAYYNSILSGPVTLFMRNPTGNLANAAWEVLAHPTAAMYDIARTQVTGEPRSIYLSEIPRDFAAGMQAIPDGFRRAWSILRNGYTLDDAVKLEMRAPEVGQGFAGTLFNSPRRILSAADTIARSFFMSYELNGRAYGIAKREGLSGSAFNERVAELMETPTPEMLAAAEEYGARNVFQARGGKLLQGLSAIRNAFDIKGVRPLNFVIPFVETPANIYKVGFRSSPFGFFARGAEPRVSAQNAGRALLGSMALLTLGYFASQGRISGNGPAEKDKRDALYRIGWRPNSIKIGNAWYSYQNLIPLNVPLSFVGNAVDMYTYDDVAPDTQGLSTFAFRELGSMMNQSFLSGINGLIGAFTGDEKEQQRFFNRYATTVIPQAYQQTVRLTDPTIYDTSRLSDSMKAALGISSELPIKYDAFGRELRRDRATGLPFFGSREDIGPMESKLIRLGVQYLSPPPNRIGSRTMTPQEYSDFSHAVGQRLFERLSVDSALPDSLTATQAQDRVDGIRGEVWKDVRAEMFPHVTGAPGYDDDSTANPEGVLDTVALYAQAIGVDPVTAFQRMFTGQRIRRIDHNTIIVYRMSVEKSEQLKNTLGSTGDLRLDHTIPLQLGGSNSRGNLRLVPTETWKRYTPVENRLGQLLREGKISKARAQRFIQDYKSGTINEQDILDIR